MLARESNTTTEQRAAIDYAAAMAAPSLPGDIKCKLCITPAPMSKAAIGLADVIDDFGVGDDKALAMLNALHTISLAGAQSGNL